MAGFTVYQGGRPRYYETWAAYLHDKLCLRSKVEIPAVETEQNIEKPALKKRGRPKKAKNG